MAFADHPSLQLRNLPRSLRAQVPRKVVRDLINRSVYGAQAPLSDECIYIDPAATTLAYRPDPQNGAPKFRRADSGKIVTGDWDLSTTPLRDGIKDQAIKDHFLRGVPWDQTALFDKLSREIAERGMADGCRSVADLCRRYRALDVLYAEASRTGTLRPRIAVSDYFRREHGGVLVHIDRNGHPLRSGGGMHRFAIARLLGLRAIPAQVGVVHFDAVRNGLLAAYRRAV